MPKKSHPTPINQTVTGNDNIQVRGSNNVINRISNFFQGDTEARRALRNRRAMLELVKNTWIKGVLEKSLYSEVLIELGMEERPSAVDHPWDMQVQMPEQANRTIPSGTSMMEIFDEMNGAMLILGEPGSGKTTMLLELARDCITRATQDDTRPIPIIFNLSSWDGKQTIDDWLVSELNSKYNVPEKTAHYWVANDDLQLLLDGVDEVKLEKREACVRAINDFRQKHGLAVPIAVCGRIADYEALDEKLNLSGAVLLQPLTPRQIDQYFEQVGLELGAVHDALKKDEPLQELAKQPLILTMMTFAYQGKPVDAIVREEMDTVETRRAYLFDLYIHQMFKRTGRSIIEAYPQEQTKGWLSWLAKNMSLRNQNVFLIEQLQPGWLPFSIWRWLYLIISRLIPTLVIIIGIELLTSMPLSFSAGCGILVLFILLGTSIFYRTENEIHILQVYRWEWRRAAKGALIGFISGILLAVLFKLVSHYYSGRAGCLYCGEGGCWLCWYGDFPISFQLFFASTVFLGSAILGGLTSGTLDEYTDVNLGIRLTLRNAMVFGLLFGLVVSLAIGLLSFSTSTSGPMVEPMSSQDMERTLTNMLNGGMAIGLFAFLWFGGVGVFRHYTLRVVLILTKVTPKKYTRFLDYAVQCIFLRRVGGGYIFVHRLLMEHFADMYPADKK